jgi:uncharacterized protein YbjT (DUF2867 family)
MILITGATGNHGRELTRLLAAQQVPFRAMIRAEQDGEPFKGVAGARVVQADFDDASSLARALSGVDRAFLLTNSTEKAQEQQQRFVDAAQRSGVRHIVKLSQFAANKDSPVRFLRYHAAVEAYIVASGMAFTFLRPNLYMQGLLSLRGAIAQGTLPAPAGESRISAVDVRDNAAVAAAALTRPGHEGRTYTLTGPEALTHGDMARAIAEASGHKVEYVDIPDAAMKKTLLELHMPPWQADGLIEDYAHYRRGEASTITRDVAEATGCPPRDFRSFARDHAPEFAASGQ